MNQLRVLMALFLLPLYGVTPAEAPMSAEALRDLLTGNTMYCTNYIRDASFINYFRADGTVTKLAADGRKTHGTWHVTDDGRHCLNWGEHQRCSPVNDLGDGTYEKTEDGNPRTEFTVVKGNPEGL